MDPILLVLYVLAYLGFLSSILLVAFAATVGWLTFSASGGTFLESLASAVAQSRAKEK